MKLVRDCRKQKPFTVRDMKRTIQRLSDSENNGDYTETYYEPVDLKPNHMDSETFFINLKKPPIQDQEHIKKCKTRKILKFIPPIHHHFYLTLPRFKKRQTGSTG